jgi:hypothetical protein
VTFLFEMILEEALAGIPARLDWDEGEDEGEEEDA